jgi:hypothetical protein
MKYYFDISTARLVTTDDVGCEFDSDEAAKSEAVRALMEVALQEASSNDCSFLVKVRNEGDEKIFQAAVNLKCSNALD